MPYDKLIKQGRVKPYKAQVNEITDLLKVAHRDLNAASRNIGDEPDWAYSMAYNAILQAGRALMLIEGYRSRGGDQHATVVEFVRERLSSPYADQVSLFDQMRRKRHRVIYSVAGLISKYEAEQAISFAHGFVKIIADVISSLTANQIHPG